MTRPVALVELGACDPEAEEKLVLAGYEVVEVHDGMKVTLNDRTLRDDFAMAALTGICANGNQVVINGASVSHDKAAYILADAMLAEREKK